MLEWCQHAIWRRQHANWVNACDLHVNVEPTCNFVQKACDIPNYMHQRWMDAELLDTVTLSKGDSAPCLHVSVWRMYDREWHVGVSEATGLYNRVIELKKRKPEVILRNNYFLILRTMIL